MRRRRGDAFLYSEMFCNSARQLKLYVWTGFAKSFQEGGCTSVLDDIRVLHLSGPFVE